MEPAGFEPALQAAKSNSCSRRVPFGAIRERKSFWNPEAQEHLPVQVWDVIRPSVNEDIDAEATAAVDDAYQGMHRLNQLALSRVEEAKQERGSADRAA